MASPDLLLRGGTVIDGTGAPARTADVLVRDGRIAAVEASLPADAGVEVRDVAGRVVCPGFVDIHTHSDLTLLSAPAARSKITQGVTTEVVGNCGLGVTPVPPGADATALRAAVSYLDLDPALPAAWPRLSGYLDAVRHAGPALNVASLVGHIVLHGGVVGFDDRVAAPTELDTMTGLLGEALDQGAVGLSTGLVYAPLTFAADDELRALGAVVADRGKVFTWHVRSYDDGLLASVAQAVDVARRTGCRTQISHLTAVGRRNWGNVARALDIVQTANDEGLTVGVDIYPYVFGNAPLSQLLPAWAQEGGDESMRARLHEPDTRDRVADEWTRQPLGWEDVTVSWTASHDGNVEGRTVAELATGGDRPAEQVVLDLLAELGTGVLMVAGGRSEDDLRDVLSHPAAVVASDGLSLDPDGPSGSGVPHPRCYGCFPRYLTRYRERDGWPEAIARCTSRPAAIVGLTDRGVLRAGVPADVLVIDPDRLADHADFTDPHRFSTGFELVVVNGQIAVEADGQTDARAGTVLTT